MTWPRKGYWRKSPTSTYINTCLNTKACLYIYIYIYIYPYRKGNKEHLIGRCDEDAGYTGTLCASCLDNYSKKSRSTCSQCASSLSVRLLIILLIFIFVLIFLVLITKSILNSALQYKARHSIYIRILINHLTIIGLLRSFDLRWPEEVYIYIYIYNYIDWDSN